MITFYRYTLRGASSEVGFIRVMMECLTVSHRDGFIVKGYPGKYSSTLPSVIRVKVSVVFVLVVSIVALVDDAFSGLAVRNLALFPPA